MRRSILPGKFCRALTACLVAGVLAAASFAPAWAQTAQQPSSRVTVRTSGDLVVVIRTLIKAGSYDDARRLIKAFRPSDPTWRYRVAYVEGLIEKDRGDYDAAVRTFRSILAERPEFSFVRIDLTEALFLAGQDDAARHNAEMLVAAGVDDRIGGGMRALIGAIDDRRPIRFRGFASLLPSTNINGGTDQTTIIIGGLPFAVNPNARRQSGIGVMLGGEVLFRQRFRKDWAMVGSLAATGRYYPSIGRLDLIADASAGIEKKSASGTFIASIVARQDLANLQATFREAGVQLEGSGFIGKKGRLYGKLRVTARDYLNETTRDGYRVEVSGFYDRFLGAHRFVRVLGGVVTEQVTVPIFSYHEFQAGIGFNTELPHGFTLYTQALYADRHYVDPLLFFGRRRDHRIEAQATLTKRNLNFFGLAPQLTYSFVRNISNYVFEDTTTHGLDLRFVKDF